MPTGVLHLKEVDTDEITLDGTLSVSGASTLEGAAVAHTTLSVGGAATLADASATNVNVSGTLSVAGQTTMGGDIIPDTNDAYDIGSPELDAIRRGADPVWGFIAQEVSEVLPYSTSLRKDFIPNIYQVSSVEETPGDQNIITFTSFNTTLLKSKTNIQLKVMDLNDEEQIVQVEEILNLHSIRVKEDLSKMIDEKRKIFVYGQEVDDFMFVKKESIFTVATAALQEVDRQLQAEKIRNDALQARLARIEAELNLN